MTDPAGGFADIGSGQKGRETNFPGAQKARANGPDPDHQLPIIPWIDESAIDYIDCALPTRLWIWEDWIPREQCTGLFGIGGVNKTDFLVQLLLAKSAGLLFLGHELEAGPVYGLFIEDTREEIVRRATKIAEAVWGKDFAADFPNFHFVSLVGFDTPELVTFDGPDMHIGNALKHVDYMVDILKVHLVTLDTLPHFFGGNEIVRREVSRFIRKLDAISIARRCAILCTAHPSRSGRQSGTLESGSTGWDGGFRARLGLEDPGPEGEDKPNDRNDLTPRIKSDRRILTRLKCNYAEQGVKIELRCEGGVFSRIDDGPEAAKRPPRSGPERNAWCDAIFLDLLARITAEGRYVNDSRNSAGHYAPKEFTAHPGRMNFTEAEFTRAMRRLFDLQRIKVAGFGPPSRGQRKIIDVQKEPDPEPDPQPAPTATPEMPPPPPPTEAEIATTIAEHVKLDKGKRALARVATAASLGEMPLGTFDALVNDALRTATRGGPRPGSGRPKDAESVAGDEFVPENQTPPNSTPQTAGKRQKSAKK